MTTRNGERDVDFHAVEACHHEIDARLKNWARWCNGLGGRAISPMFRTAARGTRARGDLQDYSDPVDGLDATKVAKGVAALPPLHRAAINWAYVKPVSPARACRAMATNARGLAQLVRDGRQILQNRIGMKD